MDLSFFTRNAEQVAQELLGKILVRTIKNKEMKSIIVETEAYFDEHDPASRACSNGDLRETMKMNGGTILVFGVHNNWLFNIVTGRRGKAEAVLIRAVEPLNFNARCNGPGLLTKAFFINKQFHRKNIETSKDLFLVDHTFPFQIEKSFRIGVTKDLPRKLRFYIKNSPFVSRLELLNPVKSKNKQQFSGIG